MKKPSSIGAKLTILIWAALMAVPMMADEWSVSQLAQYLTYGILAMSLSFIWGQAGILCFGQAIFFGMGAYLMALTTLGRFTWAGGSQGIGFLLALVGPAIAAHVLGRLLFVGRGLSGAFFAIVTLCTAMIVEIGAQHTSYLGGFDGLLGVPPLIASWRADAEMLSTNETYYLVLGTALLIYLLALMIQRSPLGVVLAAIRNNEERTSFFGYKTTEYKIFAFTVSGAIAGLAGALFTTQFGFVSPAIIGTALSTEILIWVAVGGRGVLMAAFLGVILVRSGESFLSGSLGPYWLLVLGIFFVLTVVSMPEGVFGRILRLELPRAWRRVGGYGATSEDVGGKSEAARVKSV